MARVKEAARKFLHDKQTQSSSSSSPKRSPSPPSPPSPINHSDQIGLPLDVVYKAIDTTVYTTTGEDSEDTQSDSPPTKSDQDFKTYSRKSFSSKSLPKPSKSSGPSSKEDILVKNLKKPIPLIHRHSLESFEKFSKSKLVLPGRVFNFNDLINTDHDLTKFTDPLGWTHLFNIKETHYPSLISAFYFNVVVFSGRDQIVSDLKGTKVRITEELLGRLLEIPTEGNKVYGINWFSMLGIDRTDFMTQVFEPGTSLVKDPPSSKLKHDFKMIHNMCLHSIFPRKGSKDKITHNDMMIMYYMFHQIKLNLPYVLIQHMIYTIENGNKKVTLPYGMFLTRVFRELKPLSRRVGVFVNHSDCEMVTMSSLRNLYSSWKCDFTIIYYYVNITRDVISKGWIPTGLVSPRLGDVALNWNFTTQQDYLENVLPASVPSTKGKEVVVEGNPDVSLNSFVSLEFDVVLGTNLNTTVNKFTSVLLDGYSAIDNSVNTSLFSPLITSPHKSFESFHTSEILRDLIRTPPPEFPKMPQPIFTDVGPSLPSFPPHFASLGSFSTNSYTNAAHSNSEAIPPFDSRPLKRLKVENDILQTRKSMAKMYEIVDTMYSYMKLEFSTFRTWLVDEFCPAMRVNPPPKVTAPPAPEAPKFDNASSSDDSSPTVP
ncbi:hypothetical protein TSUD_415960 [Trifolium subterraneum]|uniref:Putative plant transposon protein domain-containing protein n=1 Tax=Trifolium subterraneum TaxID=3900 RepID=A0A2Z6P609_TRISU|nr:hypothetical protein TSUD_415960 [Trifolium subterraneum]